MPKQLITTNSFPENASPALSKLLLLTAQALQQVRQGQSLTQIIENTHHSHRPAVQALSFHVMRNLGCSQWLLGQLMPKKPPANLEPLLLTSLALLWPQSSMPYTPHTVVNQAVNAVRQRAPGLASVTNAVLRRFLREQAMWVEASQQNPQAQYNHPTWWIDLLQHDWSDAACTIMAAAQSRPPLILRVNQRVMSSAQLLEHLNHHGIEANCYPAITLDSRRSLETPAAIVLLKPLPVHQIPGFDEGWWSVQDAAAQLAAPLLLQGLKSAAPDTPASHRWRVLDACSAPGGKTAHLLEMANLDLWVLDVDEQRLAKVEQNLKRLKLGEATGSQVSMRAVDARQVMQWWDGEPFDAILLDAPCSASGIVRRHPDARWLRRSSDIPALAQIQSELLDQLWPLLRPGGQMLYATCSVFKQEGQNQIDAFMQRIGLQNAQLNPTSPQHILPMVNNALADSEQTIICDGFYYGLLHKF